MAQNFLSCDRDQSYLMPPSLRDWLAEGELAWCVLDVVAEMDLRAIFGDYRADGHGRAAHDPAMMTALLLYAYAVGERSSRGIERRCGVDVAFRVICANQQPDHATIARFRVRHEEALAGLFSQVLGLCARAGLVSLGVIALDGTKLAANAAGMATRSYEQIVKEILAEADAIDQAENGRFGELRGDELPPELSDPRSRRARLAEAKRQLEDEHQAELDAHREHLEARARREAEEGKKLRGRKPTAPSRQPVGKVNITDPDSRPVKTRQGFIQGYNAQAVTTADQIIVAAEVLVGGQDQGQLEPMIRHTITELQGAGIAAKLEVALADAGYWKGEQIQRLWAEGIQALVPPDSRDDGKTADHQRRGGIYEHMRRVLASDRGKELYRQRGQTIEPIFGQTKHNRRADRFQRRGLNACRSEWRLITATHNLLKYWKATTAAVA
ncbi:transposase [Conexibacter sp. DBS9H8]|uniref:transposase n=1 Tax=Conexibacter sp. DBS9H8 TaxID=2937801 RepID=UPI0020105AA3|nr:transposase [Conexibacter sp. DBS9H8]